jgi:hypothetical protein
MDPCIQPFVGVKVGQTRAVDILGTPIPTPCHKPVPCMEMKISHSIPKKGKRKVTPYDESWVDYFDPRPKRQSLLRHNLHRSLLKCLPLKLTELNSILGNKICQRFKIRIFFTCLYHQKLKLL